MSGSILELVSGWWLFRWGLTCLVRRQTATDLAWHLPRTVQKLTEVIKDLYAEYTTWTKMSSVGETNIYHALTFRYFCVRRFWTSGYAVWRGKHMAKPTLLPICQTPFCCLTLWLCPNCRRLAKKSGESPGLPSLLDSRKRPDDTLTLEVWNTAAVLALVAHACPPPQSEMRQWSSRRSRSQVFLVMLCVNNVQVSITSDAGKVTKKSKWLPVPWHTMTMYNL